MCELIRGGYVSVSVDDALTQEAPLRDSQC